MVLDSTSPQRLSHTDWNIPSLSWQKYHIVAFLNHVTQSTSVTYHGKHDPWHVTEESSIFCRTVLVLPSSCHCLHSSKMYLFISFQLISYSESSTLPRFLSHRSPLLEISSNLLLKIMTDISWLWWRIAKDILLKEISKRELLPAFTIFNAPKNREAQYSLTI